MPGSGDTVFIISRQQNQFKLKLFGEVSICRFTSKSGTCEVINYLNQNGAHSWKIG